MFELNPALNPGNNDHSTMPVGTLLGDWTKIKDNIWEKGDQRLEVLTPPPFEMAVSVRYISASEPESSEP